MYNNPQITKARSENFQLGIKEFFELSMLVGISEAILKNTRLLFLAMQNFNNLWVSNTCSFSLCSNKNFFNSFVKRPEMKIFKQLRPLHNNIHKLNP